MSDKNWHVPERRNAWPFWYRAWRVKWADFAGVCMTLDRQKFWTRKAAQRRADTLNQQEQS